MENRTENGPNRRRDILHVLILVVIAACTWLPRMRGPLDMRGGSAMNVILGTSLAEGKGYRLLNEPGAIRTVQDPPLYPALIAAHMRLLHSSDAFVIAGKMRVTNFIFHILIVIGTFLFARTLLTSGFAFLAGIICALNTSIIYISDGLMPELMFCLLLLIFFLTLRLRTNAGTLLSFLAAVLAFFTRTAGGLLLLIWVLDAIHQRRAHPVLVRLVAASLPVILWFGYVSVVVHGQDFQTPAYAYQRADFQYYNSTYSRYVMLRNPMEPEKGRYSLADLAKRSLHYLPQMGKKVGATVVVNYGYIHGFLERQHLPVRLPENFHFGIAALFGCIALLGLLVLLLHREWLLTVFLVLFCIPVSLWPFSDEMWRPLVRAAPLFITCFVLTLFALKNFFNRSQNRILKVAGIVLVALPLIGLFGLQFFALRDLFRYNYQTVSLEHHGRKMSFRWFYYDSWNQAFDQGIDWLERNGDKKRIVVTLLPSYVYVRTGMKAVRPPNAPNERDGQFMMDSIPAGYLLTFDESVRPALPNENNRAASASHAFPDYWKKVYSAGKEPVYVWERVNAVGGSANSGKIQ